MMTVNLNRSGGNNRNQDGFTLVELLVVLGIIAVLATLVAPRVIGYLGGAKRDVAAAQIRNIESALELYYLDNGQYPAQEDGIGSLVVAPAGAVTWRGPYLKKKDALVDPWGREYVYRHPGEHGTFDLLSFGRDGKEGGDDENHDVVNW